MIIDSLLTTISLTLKIFSSFEFTTDETKDISIGFIEVIDLLFVGIVFYIFAVGLYHLFLDNTMRLPRWLRFQEFEDLKVILVSVVIVILAINFAGAIVEWDGKTDIMQVGIGIALIIAALGLVLYVRTLALDNGGRTSLKQRDEDRTPPESGG